MASNFLGRSSNCGNNVAASAFCANFCGCGVFGSVTVKSERRTIVECVFKILNVAAFGVVVSGVAAQAAAFDLGTVPIDPSDGKDFISGPAPVNDVILSIPRARSAVPDAVGSCSVAATATADGCTVICQNDLTNFGYGTAFSDLNYAYTADLVDQRQTLRHYGHRSIADIGILSSPSRRRQRKS